MAISEIPITQNDHVGLTTTTAAATLCMADVFSHMRGAFDRGLPVEIAYPLRKMIPLVSEQIGNAAIPIAIVWSAMLLGSELVDYAQEHHYHRLELVGKNALPLGCGIALILNSLSESSVLTRPELLKENLADFLFGTLCTALAYLSARYIQSQHPERIMHTVLTDTKFQAEMLEYFNAYVR